jgi:hypothetical protein
MVWGGQGADLASAPLEVEEPSPNGHGSGTTRTASETASEQAAKLSNRYDIIHLCFEFLLSALILGGGFVILVQYRDPNVASGVVAVSTLVISYWFGRARPSSR